MKKIIILFILLLILPIVNAEFNPEEASNYVSKQTSEDIITKSFQVLSLSFYDPTTADKIATQIKAAGNNCWPTSCIVKDTSLVLMALDKRGETIDTSWLLSQQTASTSGKWYLQISTSAKGTCKATYDSSNTTINVDAGLLSTSSCPTKTTKLDINSCLKSNLLAQPSKEITIDCSALGTTPTISLLNQDGSTYYIIDKAIESQKLVLTINNGYFGAIEDTLFTNWFLADINSKIDSTLWLKKNYDKSNVLHNSLMYLVTSDESYISLLTKLQDATTGSFGDTYNTAIATLALARSGKANSALESARTFLGNKQLSDGSVENNLLSTAITLYSYSITRPSEVAPTTPITPTKPAPTEICIVNGVCDVDYDESTINCPEDCECGDGVCDNAESSTACPEDCEETAPITPTEEITPTVTAKKSSAIWWVLIILIILGVLGYLYYAQYYKKGKILFGKKKPPASPLYRPLIRATPTRRVNIPIQPQRPARKSKVEEELEKSLEEAKKLLKK